MEPVEQANRGDRAAVRRGEVEAAAPLVVRAGDELARRFKERVLQGAIRGVTSRIVVVEGAGGRDGRRAPQAR